MRHILTSSLLLSIRSLLLTVLTFLATSVMSEVETVQPFSIDELTLPVRKHDGIVGVEPYKLKFFWNKDAEIHLIQRHKELPFRYTMLDIREFPIQYTLSNKSSSYYVSTPERNCFDIEPYTLFTLLFDSNHSAIFGAYEGMKYRFETYSLLDRGFTNITSRSVIIYYTDDGKYIEHLTPERKLRDFTKPTKKDWKELKMEFIFKVLFDWKLNGLIN